MRIRQGAEKALRKGGIKVDAKPIWPDKRSTGSFTHPLYSWSTHRLATALQAERFELARQSLAAGPSSTDNGTELETVVVSKVTCGGDVGCAFSQAPIKQLADVKVRKSAYPRCH